MKKEIRKKVLKRRNNLEEDIRMLPGVFKRQYGIDDRKADESLRCLFGAAREYIESFYQAVDEKYGSMDGFIRDGLWYTAEELERMKEKYLTAE